MKKELLSDKSKKLIGILLSETSIRATVFEKIDNSEKYKMYTIEGNGCITLGETRFKFWNKLIGCQLTVPFESFALKVWQALVNLSNGLNREAIEKGLSQEIVMKAVKEKSFDWVVERLYDVATKVAQKSSISDGTDVATADAPGKSGPRRMVETITPQREEIVININGCKHTLRCNDAFGDPLFDVKLGIVDVERVR